MSSYKKTPSEEANATTERREPASAIVRLDGAWANTLIRSNLRQECNILSRALQYHQEMVEDPAGRMRERFCMILRLSALSEEVDWAGVLLPYSGVVAMLPRLRFLGSDVTNRVLARRRVNTPVVAASLWPSTNNPRGVGGTSAPHDKDRNEGHPEDVRKHILNAIVKLDWVQRREEAQELEALIHDVAGQLGRPPDWLPSTCPELAAQLAAHNGCFAYLVAAQDFCEVVLVDGTSIRVPRNLRLAGLSLARLQRLAAQLTTAHAADSRSGVDTGTLRKIMMMGPRPRVTTDSALEDLWRLLIHPIMKGFGFEPSAAHATRKPRIWWCPLDTFPILPLHAAGVYNGPEQDNIGNYVVSSYTPTLPALYRILKEAPSSASHHEPRMLLLTHTAGGGLPYARVEAETIRSVVPPQYLLGSPATDREPTVQDALAALPHANIVHLACHGHQDPHAPLNSGFDLADGRLTLAQLMRVRSPEHAQLAYLSACESAAHDAARPDEGLNLAATMLLAGFKSVIATMWSMNDVDGPFMAERVYRAVFQGGHLDLAAVPFALHDAVRELRESGVPASRWATYVHVGG